MTRIPEMPFYDVVQLENTSMLDRGQRYSPQAILDMTCVLNTNTYFRPTISEVMSSYLLFIGAINEAPGPYEELIDKFPGPYTHTFDALDKNEPGLRNVILPDVSSLADSVDNIRTLRPEAIFVLTHGKWNGFPHLDYARMYLDVMDKLRKRGISERHVVFMVGVESNEYIRWYGENPFMNTAWRLSMMSQFPFDLLFSTGSYDPNTVSDFWIAAYKQLKPDFLVYDPQDVSGGWKKRQANAAGIKTIRRVRSNYMTYNGFISISHSALFQRDVDGLSVMLNDDLVFREKEKKRFQRSANWRDVLQAEGLL